MATQQRKYFPRLWFEQCRGCFGQFWSLKLVFIIATLMHTTTSMADNQPLSVFRVGFSATIFKEVNQNDALAAVKVWSKTIVEERKINVDPQPRIFQSTEEISRALTNRTLECISLTAIEFASLQKQLDSNAVIIGVVSGSITEEYVIVAHRQRAIGSIGNLKGKRITINQTTRTCLAQLWLDNLLTQQGLDPSADFFEQIRFETAIGKTILPVFFRQQDAGLVSRKGLRTMIELNPQIGEQLEVLAVSPPVIPDFFCFRAGFNDPVRDRFMEEIISWDKTPAGRQILTIFKTDRLEAHPAAILKDTMQMVSDHMNISNK